jgi:hypothetical protein
VNGHGTPRWHPTAAELEVKDDEDEFEDYEDDEDWDEDDDE